MVPHLLRIMNSFAMWQYAVVHIDCRYIFHWRNPERFRVTWRGTHRSGCSSTVLATVSTARPHRTLKSNDVEIQMIWWSRGSSYHCNNPMLHMRTCTLHRRLRPTSYWNLLGKGLPSQWAPTQCIFNDVCTRVRVINKGWFGHCLALSKGQQKLNTDQKECDTCRVAYQHEDPYYYSICVSLKTLHHSYHHGHNTTQLVQYFTRAQLQNVNLTSQTHLRCCDSIGGTCSALVFWNVSPVDAAWDSSSAISCISTGCSANRLCRARKKYDSCSPWKRGKGSCGYRNCSIAEVFCKWIIQVLCPNSRIPGSENRMRRTHFWSG